MEITFVKQKGVSFISVIRENYRHLMLLLACVLMAQMGYAQTKTIQVTGTVVDETGETLPGASVIVEKSTRGVITDIDGTFSIAVSPTGRLEISYIGYQPQKIDVKNTKVFKIVMKPTSEMLKEVTIVGYGTQRKESVIGAITNLTPDNIRLPVSKLSNAIAGQMAGIVSVQRSGEPGEGSDFWIRGVSTFGANNKPLVLVDGIERDLNLVDSEDVETFSILKDATATAVYGVRGANGVVLITTRKGVAGKPVVSARLEYGTMAPTVMPKMANASQFMDMYNYAYADNRHGEIFYSPEAIEKYMNGSDPDLYPNINWMEETYKKMTTTQRVNVNISGGSERIRYYIAGSYYNENGVFNPDKNLGYNPKSDWSRFNFRSNIEIDLTSSTTINLNVSNQFDTKHQPNNNGALWLYTFKTIPIAIPKRYSDGTIARPSIGENPYNLLNLNGYNEIFTNNAQSLIALTQDFDQWVKGLKATVKYSFDAKNYALLNNSKSPTTYYATGRDENGKLEYTTNQPGNDYLTLYKDNSGDRTTYLEASLTYDRQFAKKHRVGGLFLFNMRERKDNFPGSYVLALPYRHQGIAARATYSYDDRYFIEGNFGYNGSENFAPAKRFGFFPSVAVGYMVSNETFWQPLTDVVDLFKIKASHGIIGNDQIGGNRRFAFNSEMSSVDGYVFGESGGNSIGGLGVGYPGNPFVSWEEAKKTNIGVELGFLRTLRLNADYFYERRSGIFIERGSTPSVVGVTVNPYLNLGEMENKGVDASLEYLDKFGDWTVSVRGNFTYNRNKKLFDDKPAPLYPYMDVIGKPWNQQFGYIALGYFQDEEELANSPKQIGKPRVGDLKYKDVNGDGFVNSDDCVAIGRTSIPEINYGLGASISYKNYYLSFFFQGIGNVTGFIGGETIDMSDTNQLFSNVYEDVALNYWREDRPNAKYPRLSLNGSENNKVHSTHNQVDKSFVRLKSAEIGYNFPKNWSKKIGAKSLRLYVQGNNLLTFSKFKLWDPEIENAQGSIYPNMRVFSIGLNANF